jgi:ribosomal protein S18 acetylase RimI-like enzyme
MNNLPLSIRPAVPEDAKSAIPLIRLSMGDEIDWLFGQEKNHPTDIVVDALFRKRKNRASHDACWLAEEKSKVIGLLMAFSGSELQRRNLTTGWQLAGIFGLPATIRLERRQPVYGNLIEADKDEFYLSNLGVSPELQGQGIGTSMLSFADELARTAGFSKCSLIVTYDNPACQWYERCGYRIVDSYDIPHPVIAHGSGGYHRMAKVLDESPGEMTT